MQCATFLISALAALVLATGVSASDGAAHTISTFWSMDVERQTPLDIQMVSSRIDGEYKTEQFYMTSAPLAGRTPDRVLCTYCRNIKPGVKSPAYVGVGSGTPESAVWFAKHIQCAFATIEWRNANLPVRSKWSTPNDNPYLITPKVTDSIAYPIVMVVRRLIDYLSEQPEIDSSRIASGGWSFGGWFALLLASIDNRVNCVYDVYASGSKGDHHGWHTLNVAAMQPDQREIWLSLYDPATFAAHNKAKTMMVMGTNDYSFWLCDALYQYNALAGDKRILILPNFNHNMAAFGYHAPDCFGPWFASAYGADPDFPRVTEPVADKDTYTFTSSGPVPIDHARLYWSPGLADSLIWPARYWLEFDAHLDGGQWKANLPAPYAAISGLVFASVFDKMGRAVSSRLVSRDGADPAKGSMAWKDGSLWDIERGAGAWRIPGAGKRGYTTLFDAVSIGADGLKITPAADGTFGLLTDSVQISSPNAAKHKGIRIIIDGSMQAGHLRVSLDRNAGSIDEISFVNELDYPAGVSTFDLPWSGFKNPENTPGPAPFEALRFEGTRTGQTPLTLQSIAFMD